MEDEEIQPRVATSAQEKCVERFKELWSIDEMKNNVIPDMSPNILKIYSIKDMKISNHNKLAQILYDSVGSRFLRSIENNTYKRHDFLEHILTAAISKNMVTENEIIDLAKSFYKTKANNIDKSSDKIKHISQLPANGSWVKQLAISLGFPTSVAEKDSKGEEFHPHEHVVPTLDLNPLYDYQHSTGMEIRKMLEGRIDDKRILISVPTGSGKTRMIVETLIEWLNDGKPSKNHRQRNSKFILWIAQSRELCEQAVSAFKTTFQAKGRRGTVLHLHRYWGNDKKEMPVSVEKLDEEYSERSVVVSTIQSLMAIFRKNPQTIEQLSDVTSCIVIDEAHHSIADSYNAVLGKMGFNINRRKQEISTKGIILIGLTATPFRGSGNNVETQTLLRRYGRLYFPTIPYYEGEENFKPHALIDCQTYSTVDSDVRIIGERSYDRDGFIKDEDFRWKISKIKKFLDLYSKNVSDEKTEWTFEKERNINFPFPEEGEYKITLEVTDNEGEKSESSVYIKILPKTKETEIDDTDKQKSLYKKLIKRKVLCEVYHWILKSGSINLSTDDLNYLKKFKEFKPETIRQIGNDDIRNKRILDTIHDIKTKHKRDKILFFGCSVEHSRDIANALKILYNIEARYVDSKMGIDQRIDAIEQFRNGNVEVLCNYDVLTTGFDAPNINCVFVGRPVRSTLMYTQIIGRGLRGTKSGGTDDVLLVDIDDNFQLHESYGYSNFDKGLTELGWKVFSEYWKPWTSEQPSLKQDIPSEQNLYQHYCDSCGIVAKGMDEIKKLFEIDGVDEFIDAIESKDWPNVPSKCKSCLKLEMEPAFSSEIEPENDKATPELPENKPISADSESFEKECPRCHTKAGINEIEEIFGYLTTNGKQKPQSHCRKCRDEQLRSGATKKCPFVGYLENQNNIQDNYQMILGLYALGTQNGSLPKANMEDACNTLLKYNPDKTRSLINKNHSVFGVYYRNNLIKHIDAIDGDITFETILNPKRFEKICNEKLHDYEERQKLKEQKQKELEIQSSKKLDEHFYKLKDLAFGHVPTYSQFDQSTSSGLKTLMHRLYGGYDNYLKSKGESVLNDPKLQDTLYEEYFELYSLVKIPVTSDMLDEYGDYRVDEYIECFGSFEKFDSIVKDTISKIKNISPSVTIDDLFQDYERIKNDLGHVPHFEEMRQLSYLGMEYYLENFGTFGKFIKIYDLDPEDRYFAYKIRMDFYHLKELLQVVPNFRQLKMYSEIGHKLDEKYDESNFHEFLLDVGEVRKPFDDEDYETADKVKGNLAVKFESNIEKFGKEKAIQIFYDENVIPYTEWYYSKEGFLEIVSSDKDLIDMYKVRMQQQVTPSKNLEKRSFLGKLVTNSTVDSCPKCNSKLEKFDGGVACTNNDCGYYQST